MQIKITNHVKLVAAFFEPQMRKALRAHEVTIISRAAVKDIMRSRRPRHAQALLESALGGGVRAIEVVRRRIARRVPGAICSPNLLECRVVYSKRSSAVSAPRIRRAEHQDRRIPALNRFFHDERDIIKMRLAI